MRAGATRIQPSVFPKRQRRTIFAPREIGNLVMRQTRLLGHLSCAALLAGALAVPWPSAASVIHDPDGMRPNTVLGPWATEDGEGVIWIDRCGDALCGRIVGIRRRPGQPMPEDVHGIPECGMTIIDKEKPAGDGSWLGEVTDPRSGAVYSARIWVDELGDLHVRGYIGLPLLGQTQIWHRYRGRLTEACEMA